MSLELPAVDRMRGVTAPYVSVAVVVAAAISAGPFTDSGRSIATLVLFVINSVLLLGRSVPDRFVSPRLRVVIVIASAVFGAALLGVAANTAASIFVFFAAGQAGFRFRAPVAVAIAAATSVLSCVALWTGAQLGYDVWPYLFGLFTGWPVLLGMGNRQRIDALTNAQIAVREAGRAAQAESRERTLAERARIARDIHDVLAHSLSGVSMQLEMVDALMEGGRSDDAHDALVSAQSMVRSGLVEARQAVYALREDTLDLTDAIRALAGTAEFGVVGQSRPLDGESTRALMRAAQESVTNAARHAPGAPVRIGLTFTESSVELQVDNDPGVAPGVGGGSGMGLVGMRERVAALGGTVAAGPHDGGWRVRVRIDR